MLFLQIIDSCNVLQELPSFMLCDIFVKFKGKK